MKVCPLLTIAGTLANEGKKYCLEHDCAWYNPPGYGSGGCAVQQIPFSLGGIEDRLSEIERGVNM